MDSIPSFAFLLVLNYSKLFPIPDRKGFSSSGPVFMLYSQSVVSVSYIWYVFGLHICVSLRFGDLVSPGGHYPCS